MELKKLLSCALVCGAAFLAPASPAASQGWRESPQQFWQRERQIYNRYPAPDRGWSRHPYGQPYRSFDRYSDPYGRQLDRPRLPTVRVQSPQYFSYKLDELSAVPLGELARLETASQEGWQSPGEGSFAEARAHLESLSIRALPEVGEAIISHYSAHPKFVWVEGSRVRQVALDALDTLAGADEFGLSPADYSVTRLEHRASEGDDRGKSTVAFEMELSAAVLTYILDASRGRVDPNRISGYHDLPRHKVDLTEALRALAETADVAGYLRARHPNNAQFKTLTAELARLRAAGGERRPQIDSGTFLRPGDVSEQVPQIVAAIRIAGTDKLKEKHADTFASYNQAQEYDVDLAGLVREFQREQGLAADGIVGRQTIAALMQDSNEDKIRKVELAIERLRWLPRDLGDRHVFINQPAFMVDYVEDGRTQLSMRTVIGTKKTQTYFFSDRVQYVEYNPDWTVPHSIVVNQMVPRLLSNPYYLDDKGYEVINTSGRRISSASVDWHRVAAKQVSVNVRQPPSPNNALGLLKIMFPNEHAIYMHDTPDRKLFGRTNRAFSNGCVRLEDARAMAAAVLGQDVEYVNSRIATRKKTVDQLTDDLPVHVAYFTAWPSGDGTVAYYDDVYDRDRYLMQAIERTDTERQAGS
jgi:L,D-transpeptidase YcbB